jgi:hypothetical protein
MNNEKPVCNIDCRSLYCKPNQTMALEEYYVGLERFRPVGKLSFFLDLSIA